MEKNEKMDNCDSDSMTTVNVKDFDNMDYQEPPPAYRNVKTSTTIQMTKIIAITAIVIAAMLSSSIVFSAWLTSSPSCQQSHLSPPPFEALLQPEHLRSILGFGNGPSAPGNDLESSESKLENKSKANKESSEEDDNNSGEDSAVTMLKLPLELSLQEHMFERNHRSHMNCVIEKKKAEEIVDEQSKPLPLILGINMTTDPRYLHFTGEKMAISCDSGNDHRQAPPMPMNLNNNNNINSRRFHGQPLSEVLNSAIAAAGSSSLPIHIIGPIPMTENEAQQFQSQQYHPQQYHSHQFQQDQQQQMRHQQENNNNGPFGALGIPPHLIPVLMPQGNHIEESSVHSGPFFIGSHQNIPQSGEIRERALPHPIPIMPRAHVQHVIRPRSVDNKESSPKRVKRCSCDCACKNHPQE